MTALQFTWVENVTADIELDQLVELFREYAPGKVEEILTEHLTEYLADNPDEDDSKSILAAIRAGDSTMAVDYSDVESSEIDG